MRMTSSLAKTGAAAAKPKARAITSTAIRFQAATINVHSSLETGFGFWNVWPSYRILLYPFWIKPVVFVASWIKEFTILSGGRRAAMAIRWGLGRSPLDGLAARRLGGVAPYPRSEEHTSELQSREK